MKKEVRIKCSDEIKRVIDQEAESVAEISEITGYSRSHTAEISLERVRSGQWEKVWKREGTRIIQAYRVKPSSS